MRLHERTCCAIQVVTKFCTVDLTNNNAPVNPDLSSILSGSLRWPSGQDGHHAPLGKCCCPGSSDSATARCRRCSCKIVRQQEAHVRSSLQSAAVSLGMQAFEVVCLHEQQKVMQLERWTSPHLEPSCTEAVPQEDVFLAALTPRETSAPKNGVVELLKPLALSEAVSGQLHSVASSFTCQLGLCSRAAPAHHLGPRGFGNMIEWKF